MTSMQHCKQPYKLFHHLVRKQDALAPQHNLELHVLEEYEEQGEDYVFDWKMCIQINEAT